MVSSDLDLRSLEQVSLVSFTKKFEVSVYLFLPIFQVSRGLYVCSRDSEIWKLACLRYATFKLDSFAVLNDPEFCFSSVWNSPNSPSTFGFTDYRDMFIYRPRLQFHGCYISKTSYVRQGENSFQDTNYQVKFY